MAEDWENKKHTGNFVGREGNKGMALYNPETDNYERFTLNEFNDKGLKDNASFYTNKYGEHVYGYTPENRHHALIGGESAIVAGKDPYAGMFSQMTDNGTPVPGTGILNPNFVAPESRFQQRNEQQGSADILYHGASKTPAQQAQDRQNAYNQAFTNNPELANSPEFAESLANNPGFMEAMANRPKPAWEGSGQDALDFAQDYADRFHQGKGDATQHQANMDEAKAFSKDASLLQALGDHAIETKTGVQEFLNTARNLHMYNPEAFAAWEEANPEMAIRYHARAKAPAGNVGGIEGYDHGKRAEELAFRLGYEDGFGTDNKKDGQSYAYNFDDFNDISNEKGDGDFWKLGTKNTHTNDFSDFIEENPWQVAAMVGGLAAPWAAPALAGAMGVSNAVASGIISAGTAAIGGGSPKDILTAGLISWGIPAGSAKMNEVMGQMAAEAGNAFDAANGGLSFADGAAYEDAIQEAIDSGSGLQGLIDAGYDTGGMLQDIGKLGSDYREWEGQQGPGGKYDPIQPESNPGGNPPVPPNDSAGGGGGGGGGGDAGGAPSAPTAPSDTPGEIGSTNEDFYVGDLWDEIQNTTDKGLKDALINEYNAVAKNPYDPSGRPETNPEPFEPGGEIPPELEPPTPQEDLPEGYRWVLVNGEWDLQSIHDEQGQNPNVIGTGDGFVGEGSGSGSGTGSGSGSGSGTGSGGTGSGTGSGSGSGSGSGTGSGTGSGNGSGDGSGDGDGSGPGEGGTPLADGLMGMLGGSTEAIPLWKAPKARRIAAAKNYEDPRAPRGPGAYMPNNIWGRKV